MIVAWAGALLAMMGSTMAFLQFDIPVLVYIALYYSILSIPILLLDGASSSKATFEVKPGVSEKNILPSGSKRVRAAPSKFRTSEYDLPKPHAKEESFIPEAIRKKDTMNGVTVYEIKWEGLSESENTWTTLDHMSPEYAHLISEFEAANSPSKPSRKSMNKEAKGLWPPADTTDTEKQVERKSARAPKRTATKTKPDSKENAAPQKPAPEPPVPSPKKTRNRSSSVARKTATKKVAEKKDLSDEPSPRRTRRSVAQKI